jgi:UDP-glucose 4-epimerase
MKPTILITGGAGYIGSHAVRLFLENGYPVVVFDSLFRGYREAVDVLKRYGDLEFVEGDLRDRGQVDEVFRRYRIGGVLHFAALCLVNESMERPGLYFENNVGGTLNLLEAMRENGVDKIIFSSTCATYGESQYLPVDEVHPQRPENPYGESKLMAERMLQWYGRLHGFRYVIFRYFNVCGASRDGAIGDSKRPSQLLMQNAVRGAMDIEPFEYTCGKVDTPDGTPVRDYIDVEDLVGAHYKGFEYLEKGGRSDIFNLGNGKGYSVKEIVCEVEKAFGVKIPERKGESRKGEYANIYANPEKARVSLGWKSAKSLSESIASLKEWYARFPDGYEY